jgi:hypothetical protein
MRLITWNMAGGFAHDRGRHERAWRHLEALDPEVALCQEAVVPAWAEERWPYVVSARKYQPRSHDDIAWGSTILSKDVLTAALPEAGSWLEALWGPVVVARCEPLGMWLASIHSNAYPLSPERLTTLPLSSVRRCHEDKVWEVEVIAHELERLFSGDAFIAGGDLNSGLLFDTTYRYDHNARLFDNLAVYGLVDLRVASGIVEEQQTYFKESMGPYQLDHVFADASTSRRVRSWSVLADQVVSQGLSDHAPIEVIFD